jgi:hypothetical protein
MTKIESFRAAADHIKRNFDLKEDEKEESKKVESAVKVYSKIGDGMTKNNQEQDQS